KSAADHMAPMVIPISIDLDDKLSDALGFDGENDAQTELLDVLIPQLRDALYLETGVRFPGVRVRSKCPGLPSGGFVVRLKDVPVASATVATDLVMAIESPARLKKFGVPVKVAPHPVLGTEVALIPQSAASAVEASGVSVWSPAGIIALHLAACLRRR